MWHHLKEKSNFLDEKFSISWCYLHHIKVSSCLCKGDKVRNINRTRRIWEERVYTFRNFTNTFTNDLLLQTIYRVYNNLDMINAHEPIVLTEEQCIYRPSQ